MMCVQISKKKLLNFPKFQFRMMAPPQFRRTYSNTSMRNIQNRKEYYDKHGQIICITLSPVSGHKLPLLVKFPKRHPTSGEWILRLYIETTVRDYSTVSTMSRGNMTKRHCQLVTPVVSLTTVIVLICGIGSRVAKCMLF